MTVQIISDTVQKFNGESYYKCGPYYQRKGRRLHRTVWEFHNGEIPKGYHVHHIDHDRSHNDIGNLALVFGRDHLLEHAREPARRENGKRAIKFAQEAAKAWHHSEEGKEWHSRISKATWAAREPVTKVCVWCGNEYQSRDMAHKGDTYCCANHKAAALRWRRAHEGKTDYPMRKG